MSWFKRKKKISVSSPITNVAMDIKTYPAKIILAWIKSLEGHVEITKWLTDNDYKEIPIFNQAIYLKKEARSWLMKNNFPHLMAFLNAMEGDQKALFWLRKFGLMDYYNMALAIENEQEGWQYLKENDYKELFALSLVLKNIKDKIEESHNDVHRFGSE